ncbi:hypothetical protein M3Y97_00616400 [Aphelenchoides bicaudatus]|nr:hypothetical protein M3Y97_00616400 [Aphelenchoides bicaudatus]
MNVGLFMSMQNLPYIGSVLLILFIAILACMGTRTCVKSHHDNQVLKSRVMFQNNLPEDSANRLLKLTRDQGRYRITKGQLNRIYQLEFYIIARWAKRLEKLKQADSSTLNNEVDNMITEMEEHASRYRIPDYIQEEIMQVCQNMPEQSLREYDNLFIGEVV